MECVGLERFISIIKYLILKINKNMYNYGKIIHEFIKINIDI